MRICKMGAAGDFCRRSLSSVLGRRTRFFCTDQSARVKIFDRNLKRKQVPSSFTRNFSSKSHASLHNMYYNLPFFKYW